MSFGLKRRGVHSKKEKRGFIGCAGENEGAGKEKQKVELTIKAKGEMPYKTEENSMIRFPIGVSRRRTGGL